MRFHEMCIKFDRRPSIARSLRSQHLTVGLPIMRGFFSIGSLAVLASLQATSVALIDNKTYEYIVVGSGPGGAPVASNLARAGHSVLLIEAGDDQTENVSLHTCFVKWSLMIVSSSMYLNGSISTLRAMTLLHDGEFYHLMASPCLSILSEPFQGFLRSTFRR